MGILKKVGKAIGSVVLVFAIMALLTIHALVGFTDYETLKPIFIDVIQAQADSQMETVDISVTEDELYQFIAAMCEGQETVAVPLEELGGYGGLNAVNIDCNDFRDEPAMGSTTMDYIVNEVGEGFFDQFYYQEYDCEFVDCINRGEFYVIMSEKGHQDFSGLKMWPWVFIAAGVVIVYLSAESWAGLLKSLGWSLAFLGISYIIMGYVTDVVVDSMPGTDEVQEVGIDIMTPVNAVLKPILDGLLYVLILGIVFLAAGYAIELYQRKHGKGPAKAPEKENPKSPTTPKPKAKPKLKPKTKPDTKPKPTSPPTSESVPHTLIDWD
jgi:hypothetical protein